MLGGFSYDLTISPIVFSIFCFLSLMGDIFWFYSTIFFNSVNIMFIESFSKVSFASYNFSFFNKWNLCSPKTLCLLEIAWWNSKSFFGKVCWGKILCFCFIVRHTSFIVFYKLLCFLWQDFCSFCFSIYF